VYNRLISGTLTEDTPEAKRVVQEVFADYREYLGSLDLSRAGDLLPFFGGQFFHDAGIRALRLSRRGRDLVARMEAWPFYTDMGDGLPDSIAFDARFCDIAGFEVHRDNASTGITEFRYAEIDGLTDRIDAAAAALGGEFHSLTVECDEGWILVVFRSVQVVPRNRELWTRVLQDSRAVAAMPGFVAGS
jgi:hypothetical protein